MAERPTVEQLIDFLNLEPHPEGGYYRETYRSAETVKRNGEETKNAGTGIYFLIPAAVCTNWHRVGSDELWHFYNGDKLVLEIITTDGKFKQILLGDNPTNCSFQELVAKNCWQRAYSTGDYSLVGCTVAPGFEFEDFEMIEQKKLANRYPDIASKIKHEPF